MTTTLKNESLHHLFLDIMDWITINSEEYRVESIHITRKGKRWTCTLESQ